MKQRLILWGQFDNQLTQRLPKSICANICTRQDLVSYKSKEILTDLKVVGLNSLGHVDHGVKIKNKVL
jgi:hypothetical protein